MVKVSVVLPIYNVAPYLDEAFQSLLGQTLSDIEIIAVNDGATDNSQDYIDKYMALDSRIKSYRQENQGLSGARNTGMKYCQGEYVYFMDSDDILEKDALQTAYDYARKHQADVCIFDAQPFYEPNAAELMWDYNRSYLLKEDRQYGGEELLSLLLDQRQHHAVVWLQLIRWEHLHHLQLQFYRGIIHEDELFTPLLFLQTDNIFYLNRKYVMHRVRNSSIIGRGYSKRNMDCYLTVYDELFKFQDSPIVRKLAHYTLSRVFYTGHQIPFRDKPAVFWRALKAGYLKYIGLKPALVFWFK